MTKKKNQPRAHHYCPESYLAGFTDNGSKTGKIWAFDSQKGLIRKSKPKNEAHQRDFYKMVLDDGSDSFALETDFSKIESHAIDAIRHIEKSRTLPDIEALAYLLNFTALLAVRTPSFRKKMNNFNEEIAKKVMEISCATEERFELTKKRLAESGRDVADITFDEMQKFLNGGYNVETHQNEHLVTMLQMVESVQIVTRLLLVKGVRFKTFT